MLKEDFLKGFELLCQRFNKGLKAELAEVYFHRVKKIPVVPWKDIVMACIDDSKFFPTPGELKRGWFDWQKDHPGSVQKRRVFDCDFCHGNGILEYKTGVKEGLFKLEYMKTCRCGHCRNWVEACVSPDFPMFRVEQLEKQGFSWIVAGVPVDVEPWPPSYLKEKSVKKINLGLAYHMESPYKEGVF